LRQLACHPILVKKDFEGESGKFSEIIEMWREIHENGHKVLIFSSFVQHLALFRAFFEKEKIGFAWLTGENSAIERQRAVDHFSENEDVRVLLCSLKAGGVGLNLTAADYVFLLDPWWNPAAEKQAIARAHRGGQTQPVIALRFVSRGTIEEKIVELQRRKEQLFADLFDFDGEPTLIQEDLSFLLD
jgi:SNF2 family DNA or RNA helicase